jgi:hypothetical protein
VPEERSLAYRILDIPAYSAFLGRVLPFTPDGAPCLLRVWSIARGPLSGLAALGRIRYVREDLVRSHGFLTDRPVQLPQIPEAV